MVISSNWFGRSREEGGRRVPSEAQNEYLQPTYGNFRSVLIVVVVFVAIILGAILILS